MDKRFNNIFPSGPGGSFYELNSAHAQKYPGRSNQYYDNLAYKLKAVENDIQKRGYEKYPLEPVGKNERLWPNNDHENSLAN